jgi:hypothetical protein
MIISCAFRRVGINPCLPKEIHHFFTLYFTIFYLAVTAEDGCDFPPFALIERS